MDLMPDSNRRGGAASEERISSREVELIKFRDSRTNLQVKLLSGDEFIGAIRWYDDRAIRLVQDDRSEVTIYLNAVAFYRSLPNAV
ncbi:MAG: hypothetical protein ABIY70_12360 [Capsulimonas sp.]|uniref:Hfq-like protein n=1 Tax=Capsulimonas sp. TaxID=2494211 RepID=UPI0032675745